MPLSHNTSPPYSDSLMCIPARAGSQVRIRFAPLGTRDRFDPHSWRSEPLQASADRDDWLQIDIGTLGLDDGSYEYEFIVDGVTDAPIADPYAEEVTRFGGYRGLFHVRDGKRWRQTFCWDDEFSPQHPLRNNHQLVIYEMPMRWMESAPERIRQVGLGTFEKVVFAHLDRLQALGINAIELLPVQDSPDTLNWGYGTRFFFAPDLDMGPPLDLKFFVKQCHRRGIRVIFDVVMNHARNCPLEHLDQARFFLSAGDEERGYRGDDYGARLFRYWPGQDGQAPAQDFQLRMADFLITEYHADGFRIDEFRGINNWAFVQRFRDHAWRTHQQVFPTRPFIVIAEDSWRRAGITQAAPHNPNGRQVTDSMWNFAFRDELRRAFRGRMDTAWGEPPRRERVRWMLTGGRIWDDWKRQAETGFQDISQAVNYLTSHDVEQEDEKRIMNDLLTPLLEEHGYRATVDDIRWIADRLDADAADAASGRQRYLHGLALERLRSAFCLLMTAVGMPMILAGDEFGDVHDLDHSNWRLKMSDPVDWGRLQHSANNRRLCEQVSELIGMRTRHPALARNETAFFHFHPDFDQPAGTEVFAMCRTGDRDLGSQQQVVVIANLCEQSFDSYILPWYQWDPDTVREIAAPQPSSPLKRHDQGSVTLSLAAREVRVFTT